MYHKETINACSQIDSVTFPYSYARTAYCDVTGRESRLPLRIRGDGAGPRVHFSLDTLDIGNVFINSQHSYEVSPSLPFVAKYGSLIDTASANRDRKVVPREWGNRLELEKY